MIKYENLQQLWCVVAVSSLREVKGNITGHIWRSEAEACTQADQLAADGSSSVVFKMEPLFVSKMTGVVREKIPKAIPEFTTIKPIIKPTTNKKPSSTATAPKAKAFVKGKVHAKAKSKKR
jgi:hypothetical protein